jgi:RNA polymerase sigma factor (sigma-70 family)
MSSYPTALQDKGLSTRAEAASTSVLHVEMTDNNLVELVLAGDAFAFEQIFDRHKRLVAVVAARYFRRHEEIEEIVQIAFAKAFHELAKFRGLHERSFASWLVRITSNICFDTLRDQKRKPETLHVDLSDHEADAILTLTADHSCRAEQDLLDQDLIEKLLGQLPADDRALLTMMYSEEMTIAEISESLGWTQSNVKVRAWRARRSLKKVLKRLL